MEEQQKQSFGSKLKSFFLQNKRVLKITRKPNKEEFKVIFKISGLGTLAIGFIGFVIHIIGMFIIK